MAFFAQSSSSAQLLDASHPPHFSKWRVQSQCFWPWAIACTVSVGLNSPATNPSHQRTYPVSQRIYLQFLWKSLYSHDLLHEKGLTSHNVCMPSWAPGKDLNACNMPLYLSSRCQVLSQLNMRQNLCLRYADCSCQPQQMHTMEVDMSFVAIDGIVPSAGPNHHTISSTRQCLLHDLMKIHPQVISPRNIIPFQQSLLVAQLKMYHPLSSPSAHKLERMSSGPLLSHMKGKHSLQGLSSPSLKRPHQPTLSAVVHPSDAIHVQPAHPIVHFASLVHMSPWMTHPMLLHVERTWICAIKLNSSTLNLTHMVML